LSAHKAPSQQGDVARYRQASAETGLEQHLQAMNAEAVRRDRERLRRACTRVRLADAFQEAGQRRRRALAVALRLPVAGDDIGDGAALGVEIGRVDDSKRPAILGFGACTGHALPPLARRQPAFRGPREADYRDIEELLEAGAALEALGGGHAVAVDVDEDRPAAVEDPHQGGLGGGVADRGRHAGERPMGRAVASDFGHAERVARRDELGGEGRFVAVSRENDTVREDQHGHPFGDETASVVQVARAH
jgi:hypothetical protein